MSIGTNLTTGSIERLIELVRSRLEQAGARFAGTRLGAASERLWHRTRPQRAEAAAALGVRFKLHGHDDPEPDGRKLAVMSAWGSALGLGGAAIALRLLAHVFMRTGGWYGPVVFLLGVVGVFATIGAFASIHRLRLPWYLLWTGTAALALAVAATVVV